MALQEYKNSKRRPSVADTKDWPELAPVKPGPPPEQVLAEAVVKMRAENARKRLVVRSKALLVVVVLALLSVIQDAFHVIPALLRGEATISSLLSAGSMVLQLSTSAYFLMARDPEAAAQVLRLLLILNGLALLIGLAWLDSLPITLASMVLLFIAYKRMDQLKYGGD
jgi:hypothetical protein